LVNYLAEMGFTLDRGCGAAL